MTKGAAEILEVTPGYIRQLAQVGLLPVVTTLPEGQRVYDVPALLQSLLLPIANARLQASGTGIATSPHFDRSYKSGSAGRPPRLPLAHTRRHGTTKAQHDRSSQGGCGRQAPDVSRTRDDHSRSRHAPSAR